MTASGAAGSFSELRVGGAVVEVLPLQDFLAADDRRPASFVSNFGDWQLPEAVTAALGSPVAHLEWFHDTGELVAIGDVPRRGSASVSVPTGEGTFEGLGGLAAGPFGGAGMVRRTAAGTIREFPEMVVAEGTRVAVLAVVRHGPQVHELLWDWHRRHRDTDGWAWLEKRLARISHPADRG